MAKKFKWNDGQKLALEKEGNLLVSASAGSGKTAVMIEKILRYLDNGGDIRRVIAVTFGKAAAEEMREKLLVELYKRIQTAKDSADRLLSQVKNLPFSYITTIDGLCGEIMRRYFEDVEADPAFSMAEPETAAVMYFQGVEELLTEKLKSGDSDFLDLADAMSEGRKLDGLIDVLYEIHNFISVLPEPYAFLQKAESDASISDDVKNYILTYFRKRFGIIRNRAESVLKKINEEKEHEDKGAATLCEKLDNIISKCAEISYVKELEPLFSFGKEEIKTDKSKIKTELSENILNEVRVITESFKKMMETLHTAMKCDLSTFSEVSAKEENAVKLKVKLVRLAQEAEEKYSEIKRKEKKVDFAEVERKAYEILSNPERVEEIKKNFDLVLIDEYQDTNAMQEMIMNSLADGNLFMVGDIKQAIYRFRFAEPALFINRRRDYEKNVTGSNVPLNYNFRSSKNILNFVNNVFSVIMTEDFGGVDYAKDAMLKTEKDFLTDKRFNNVSVAYFAEEKTEYEFPEIYTIDEAPLEEEKRSDEAEYVADKILEMVNNCEIYDKYIDGMRKANYGDIVVLTRRRVGGKFFKTFKRKGIPFSAEKYSDNANDRAVKMLVSYLRLLDNPKQDIELLTVMKSYFGGFTEAELMEIRRDSPCADFFYEAAEGFRGAPAIREKLDAFYARLNRYRALAAVTSVDKTLGTLLTESGYDAAIQADGDTSAIETVNTFINSLRGKESARELKKFLASMDAGVSLMGESAPSAADAVRFMTVHASKGLEFPIVFYVSTEFEYSERRDTQKFVHLDSEFGVSLKSRDEGSGKQSYTISSYAFHLKNLKAELEEEMRLTYVAFTRAKYFLFVTGTKKNSEKIKGTPEECRSVMDYLYYARERNKELCALWDDMTDETSVTTEPELGEDAYCERKISFDYSYPYEEATVLNTKYSVSGIAAKFSDEKGLERNGRNLVAVKAETGTLYHAILENVRLDVKNMDELRTDIEEKVEEGVLPAEALSANVDIVFRALNGEIFRAAKSGRVLRETPFMLYLSQRELFGEGGEDKVLVQGVIDLLILGEENVLVDYKFSNSPPEILKERYRKQIELYALAAEESLNICIDKRIIYVINENIAIEI